MLSELVPGDSRDAGCRAQLGEPAGRTDFALEFFWLGPARQGSVKLSRPLKHRWGYVSKFRGENTKVLEHR